VSTYENGSSESRDAAHVDPDGDLPPAEPTEEEDTSEWRKAFAYFRDHRQILVVLGSVLVIELTLRAIARHSSSKGMSVVVGPSTAWMPSLRSRSRIRRARRKPGQEARLARSMYRLPVELTNGNGGGGNGGNGNGNGGNGGGGNGNGGNGGGGNGGNGGEAVSGLGPISTKFYCDMDQWLQCLDECNQLTPASAVLACKRHCLGRHCVGVA
jgi:uncharacterized membrane protein YgcG